MLLETRIAGQIIPAGIEAVIAVCWASRDLRGNFELLERATALGVPRVNQRQVGNAEVLFERYRFLRLL